MANRDPCDDPSVRKGLLDEAAEQFLEEHLELIGSAGVEKEALYVCPLSGQLWLREVPVSGPGSVRLRIVHEHPSWYSMDYQDWRPDPLPEGWEILPNEVRRTMERELSREVAPGHRLYGETVVAIAKCVGCDDVLFSIEGEYLRWTVVHVTFARHPEQLPWPMTEVFSSFGEARKRLASHRH